MRRAISPTALFGFTLVFFAIIAGLYYVGVHASSTRLDTETVRVDGTPVTVEIARTPAEQELGLGGRASLDVNSGMLFVFPTDGEYAFWMKDMEFPIDIVWIDASGKIVTIAPNVSPDTYPQSFQSTAPARYVLELPANWTAAHGVSVGDRVQL